MPSPHAILDSLTAVANGWRALAIGWHLLLATAIAAMVAGWRPTNRGAARLLILPLISVSALAWRSGNLFNGATFAALALTLGWIACRMPLTRVDRSSRWLAAPGALLLAFAWVYPHFLRTTSWSEYAYAAPLGLLPCPTLSAVIGVTLILRLLESKAWSLAVALAGLLYGAIGVFRLGVGLDVALIAGATVLAVGALRGETV
jgi:hypothetical protein